MFDFKNRYSIQFKTVVPLSENMILIRDQEETKERPIRAKI